MGALPSPTLTLPPTLLFTGRLGLLDTARKSQGSGPRSGAQGQGCPTLLDAHTEAWSAGTPPTKKSVSRLRPSVPLGLWPRTGVSPSTESVPRRQCRDSSTRCQRPGCTGTELVSTAGPDPVSNLGVGAGTQDGRRGPGPLLSLRLPPPRQHRPRPGCPAQHLSCTRPPSSVSARKSLPWAFPL